MEMELVIVSFVWLYQNVGFDVIIYMTRIIYVKQLHIVSRLFTIRKGKFMAGRGTKSEANNITRTHVGD